MDLGGFPSHIIHAMSTPQDPNKRNQPPAKAKHIRPVNISIPVYTGMNIRKVVPLLFCIAVANQVGYEGSYFAQDIRKRPDYSIRFLDYLSKRPNNTSCRDILSFRFGSAFLGLMFFEADVVDADPYKRSTLLNVYMRFVEKQIKAMVVPLCD